MITKKELKPLLGDKVVVSVLDDITDGAKRWDGGGALVHRVVAGEYLAKSGARNIKEGRTLINSESTFNEMKRLDKITYEGTIEFILPMVNIGAYSP